MDGGARWRELPPPACSDSTLRSRTVPTELAWRTCVPTVATAESDRRRRVSALFNKTLLRWSTRGTRSNIVTDREKQLSGSTLKRGCASVEEKPVRTGLAEGQYVVYRLYTIGPHRLGWRKARSGMIAAIINGSSSVACTAALILRQPSYPSRPAPPMPITCALVSDARSACRRCYFEGGVADEVAASTRWLDTVISPTLSARECMWRASSP